MKARLAGAAAILLLAARGGPPAAAGPAAPAPAGRSVPRAMEPCAGCHSAVVERYVRHGMSRSIGAADRVTHGTVINPGSGTRYVLAPDGAGTVLTATLPDGGVRRQRVVGRIGAGVFDTSWVTAEMDPKTGDTLGRLFFAPVETVEGHGLALSPFELHAGSPGVDFALTRNCLTCHTLDDPARQPGGAAFPAHQLGADAFAHLSPLTCAACHGDPRRHLDLMSGAAAAPAGEIGITRLAALPPPAQRDVCARCHLQGDARIDLVQGRPGRGVPLAGQVPVLVPAVPDDDFRFVGQAERLALSACFKASAALTCTTCHEPHTAAAAQGRASFDGACAKCHAGAAPHAEKGAAGPSGCVGCHVRRSQPFDLPHVRTADHFIRRRIPAPREVPHRSFADRTGALAVFDDGRIAPLLRSPAGRRWESGVRAMGLLSMGRNAEAIRLFDTFPAAGSAAARQPAAGAPPGLVPLETDVSFHTMRALALLSAGRTRDAAAAFSDALALDPAAAGARMGRARLRFDTGDLPGALLDTQAVIEAWPLADQPWDLRVEMAERAGRPDLALAALTAATRRWPSNAEHWLKLSLLLRPRDPAASAQALGRARALRPSIVPPGAR